MKAVIKKTNEPVEVIITSFGTYRDSANRCFSYNELEFEPVINHWQDVREKAAIAALQGIISFVGDSTYFTNTSNETIAHKCVSIADALVEELKKE